MSSLKDALKNPWVKLVGLVLGLGLLGWALYALKDVLVPFALAFIVAYVLDPVVDVLEHRRIPRSLAIALLAVALLAVVAGGGLLLALSIRADAGPPAETDPSAETTQETAGEDIEQGKAPEEIKKEQDSHAPGDPTVPVEEEPVEIKQRIKEQLHGLVTFLPEHLRSFADAAAEALYEHVASRYQEIAKAAGIGLWQTAKAAWSVLAWVFQFALFMVVTLYLLKDIDRIREKTVTLLPARQKADIVRIARKIDEDLRSFFRGQLLVAMALTVIYLVGLLIAGVPYALPVALIGGIGNFIPYLGTFLGIFAGLGASIAVYGFDIHLLYVIIVFVIGQALEGNIITPKIVGRSVGLSPVSIILAILVFGKLLGFFGVLFAVPLASTVRVFAGELLPRLGVRPHPENSAVPLPETGEKAAEGPSPNE